MRKKIFVISCLMLCFLTGCVLNNNPTSKVEELLSKYQMLDADVAISYVNLAEETDLSHDLQEKYEQLIKRQYQNLSYEIKEEEIDGDEATVTTQIDVFDYKSVLEKYASGGNQTEKEHQKIIDELEKVKKKVTYTIDFRVRKNEKGDWKLETLDSTEEDKLLGMY